MGREGVRHRAKCLDCTWQHKSTHRWSLEVAARFHSDTTGHKTKEKA
ncbi:hypothetical protein SEA_PHLORENCE_77 [Mycobacterium phage Phlorence]|nr:hypothetical protein SEA_PHLORENCE_77 [Mycobacterium phage Phlorence]ATW61266.1 hypothetical protein SEA_AGENTM_78 [Mycobacterium phage AgentM]